MTSEHAHEIERICQAALERETSEREAFLAQACAGDDVLRQEVESLLAQEPGAAGFLSTPAAALAEDASGAGLTLVGRRFGPYEILAKIDEGGMGTVYKARDTRLPRSVAVKVPKAPFSERFRREAAAIAQLNHPHICTLYDVGSDYLVMEYVEGTSLKGPLPVAKAIAYATQILDALDAAHRQHIVHRDLKPDNIIVTKQGIKLLDFGLARTEVSEGGASLTRTGDVMGTPAYMAPEQLEGKHSDARTDLYAFGCVLYEMLTGKRVTPERTPAKLPGVERIIKQCLAQDPDDRFQSAHDVKIALEWAVESQAGSVSTPPFRRKLWLAIASVVLLAVLSGWAVSRLSRPIVAESVLRFQINLPEGGQFGQPVHALSLALSPDGKTLAYVSTIAGTWTLWLRSLDDTHARQLRGTENALMPFWSPDGRFLAFFADDKLRRLDVASGTILDVCDVPIVAGGAWSPDGRILVGLFAGILAMVPAAGGSLTPLTSFNAAMADVVHAWPQVLPGNHFLYFNGSNIAENNGVIYAASLDRPNERIRLVNSETRAIYASGRDGQGYLLWQRRGALVAQTFDPHTLKLSGEPREIAEAVGTMIGYADMWVAASDNGTVVYAAPESQQLTWFERLGKTLGTLGDSGVFYAVRFSPDGKQVAVAGGTGRDLRLLDVERGTSRRMTFTSLGGIAPQWSPDGKTMLFIGENATALYRKDATGAVPDVRLAPWEPRNFVLTDWSRDGRSALNDRFAPDTRTDIWVVPVTPDGHLDPNAQPQPYLRTPVSESAGRFSPEPNPRWVAYQSDDSGRYEVYVQAFPKPRGPHRISANGGTDPQWSLSGKEIFYRSLDNKLMVVDISVGPDRVEFTTPRELFSLPPSSSFPVAPDFRPGPSFQVAPDGQRFLVTVPDPATRPLQVIVNWPALMKPTAK
jgi:WD40 repeat protein/predicted Ser/Thr protein kinase